MEYKVNSVLNDTNKKNGANFDVSADSLARRNSRLKDRKHQILILENSQLVDSNDVRRMSDSAISPRQYKATKELSVPVISKSCIPATDLKDYLQCIHPSPQNHPKMMEQQEFQWVESGLYKTHKGNPHSSSRSESGQTLNTAFDSLKINSSSTCKGSKINSGTKFSSDFTSNSISSPHGFRTAPRHNENISEKTFQIQLSIEDKDCHLGTFWLEINTKTTLKSLKMQVEQDLGIPALFQKWIFCKGLFENEESSLYDYGVLPNSSVFLYVNSKRAHVTTSEIEKSATSKKVNINKSSILDSSKSNFKDFEKYQGENFKTVKAKLKLKCAHTKDANLSKKASHPLTSDEYSFQNTNYASSKNLFDTFISSGDASFMTIDSNRPEKLLEKNISSILSQNVLSKNMGKMMCDSPLELSGSSGGISSVVFGLDLSQEDNLEELFDEKKCAENKNEIFSRNSVSYKKSKHCTPDNAVLENSINCNQISNSLVDNVEENNSSNLNTFITNATKNVNNITIDLEAVNEVVDVSTEEAFILANSKIEIQTVKRLKSCNEINTPSSENQSLERDKDQFQNIIPKLQSEPSGISFEVLIPHNSETDHQKADKKSLSPSETITSCEKAENSLDTSLLNLQLLQEMYASNLVRNIEKFVCPICFGDLESGDGVVLHDCLHMFCTDCLQRTVEYAEEASVKCPFRNDEYSCQSYLQQREIKALVPENIYDRYLQRSVNTAESIAERSFHCKTPNCQGWCEFEENLRIFHCPVCLHYNCLSCNAIHEGLNCIQYQNKLRNQKTLDVNSEKTITLLNKMIEDGKAMKCPKCDLILMKRWGCDWLKCSVCLTEICWITKGPRWGPAGQGDTSAGCKCGVNGVKCHPSCTYCH